MADQSREYKQDLVLAPGEHAYLQDSTKGAVRVYTGPTVVTPSAQDVPVIYDPETNRFRKAGSLAEAICHSPLAKEGFYLELTNPAVNGSHPDENSKVAPELDTGRQVNIAGPVSFALWPMQSAKVIEGHKLRSNQYLQLTVYNEEEARKNWKCAIQKNIDGSEVRVGDAPQNLTIGKRFLIKGTDVSFYIPPTGIRVIPEEGNYIREALTLERLEYCILIDENGRKRYERGPQVVFPEPTERFVEKKDDKGAHRKFRAIELNPIQAIHIKVIADYEDGDGTEHKAGEELFITGRDTAIYFPREEHAEVRYDGKSKHFASAIPKGEARYVLDRLTGEVKTLHGPAMCLPDARKEVFVRRVLSPRQCEDWYPGNEEVLQYNQALMEVMSKVPTTRAGAVSEGDFERGARKMLRTSGTAFKAVYMSMDSSMVSKDVNLVSGDEFSRASTYTDPRTVTLNTKYQGAPNINIWNGYAVLVISKDGSRRVEVGPKTVLLEYDETLEVLELSTGKPKTTDHLFRSAYLRVENNNVSDIIVAETSDHVKVSMKLSYRVNFEGDSSKWFSVENYVKFMTDHCRSVLKSTLRGKRVEEFYAAAETIIRDTVLGKSMESGRLGMKFNENGMRICDVEILDVQIGDEKIRSMLNDHQHNVIKSNIELLEANRELESVKEHEAIKQKQAETEAHTKSVMNTLQAAILASDVTLMMARISAQLKQEEENRKVEELRQANGNFVFEADLGRKKLAAEQQHDFAARDQERRIEMIMAEAESLVKRFNSFQGPMADALTVLSNNEALEKVAGALSAQKLFGGQNVADVLTTIFAGTPLQSVMERVSEKSVRHMPSNGGAKPELRK